MKNNLKFWYILAFVIILALLWFVIYTVRMRQLDTYVDNMNTAVSLETETELGNLKAMKVVVDDKTYTTKEFMELDEIPVIAEVIIVYDDGSMVTKKSYVSYSDDVKDFTFKDGVYGRILLPSKLYKEADN